MCYLGVFLIIYMIICMQFDCLDRKRRLNTLKSDLKVETHTRKTILFNKTNRNETFNDFSSFLHVVFL